MNPYSANVEDLTLKNSYFRQVLYTTKAMQLVLMTLAPNEEIGFEIHIENDQFFRVEKGIGKAIIENVEYPLSDGVVVIVPKGANHNIINTSATEDLKLYTIYTPAHHKDKTIHKTKEEALNDDEEFDGVTSD
jgi:mannose-6-phosphate isomerase-like protein (cupin superfamily)